MTLRGSQIPGMPASYQSVLIDIREDDLPRVSGWSLYYLAGQNPHGDDMKAFLAVEAYMKKPPQDGGLMVHGEINLPSPA